MMKKAIILDTIYLILSGLTYTVSMVLNISAFTYFFTSSSHLNLIIIFKCISLAFLVSFVFLSTFLIFDKISKTSNLQKLNNKIKVSTISFVVITSIISAITVQVNYKPYGDNIIKEIQNDEKITCIDENFEIDSLGVSLFGTKVVTFSSQGINRNNYIIDCITSKSKSLLNQYYIQFEAANTDKGKLETIKYKDIQIKKWKSVTSLADYADVLGSKTDGTNETIIYIIQEENCIFYCESFTVLTEDNQLDGNDELENLYLIYKTLTNV